MQLSPLTPEIRDGIIADIVKQDLWFTWGLGEQDGVPVDDLMPLLGRGMCAIIAGAQGSGKTTVTMEMAKQNAVIGKQKGFQVGFLSLEVDPVRVVRRYAERKACMLKTQKMYGIHELMLPSIVEIAQKEIDAFIDSGILMIRSGEEIIQGANGEMIENTFRNIDNIEKYCSSPDSPPLIFIDNLNELQPPVTLREKIKDEYTKYDYIMRNLLRICMETDTTIVLLHHTAKPKENAEVTIDSVKGNNIVITKADITVMIDKHKMPNPNFNCKDFKASGDFVTNEERAKLIRHAPKVEARAVKVFKDRDWDEKGTKGYLNLKNGQLECWSYKQFKEIHTLFGSDIQRYEGALKKYGLLPRT